MIGFGGGYMPPSFYKWQAAPEIKTSKIISHCKSN
jgi:hypothetical protein